MVQAWYLDDSAADPRRPNRAEPARPVGLEQLRRLGILYWKLDPDRHESDPELEKIRKERHYSWMDIVTLSREELPDYEEKARLCCSEGRGRLPPTRSSNHFYRQVLKLLA
ncbi:unnamed protein product [Pipistrellus nathusii]|uniref:acireductone dioxygenase (Fe(2+)-requiring) n=1 Tax=Pipistrellus nathusii TaxID=59473 RepID=A0ABP0A309_PIPNA